MTARRLLATLFSVLALVPAEAPCRGGETAPASPEAGDWYEYVVAYPLDPMENAIRETLGLVQPVPAGDPDPAGAEGGRTETRPSGRNEPVFDPETVWFAMPLRLEILRVDRDGCQAMLAYAGLRHEVFLPLARDGASSGNENGNGSAEPSAGGPAVAGDDPRGEAELAKGLESMFGGEPFAGGIEEAERTERRTGRHWIGDREIEAELERNPDPDLGFTKLASPEAPFGLARFATAHVDFILVDRGSGSPPDFPVPGVRIDPPPGKLHPGRD